MIDPTLLPALSGASSDGRPPPGRSAPPLACATGPRRRSASRGQEASAPGRRRSSSSARDGACASPPPGQGRPARHPLPSAAETEALFGQPRWPWPAGPRDHAARSRRATTSARRLLSSVLRGLLEGAGTGSLRDRSAPAPVPVLPVTLVWRSAACRKPGFMVLVDLLAAAGARAGAKLVRRRQ